MPKQRIFQDPKKNAYQVGIAHRLRVDPTRVECHVRAGTRGGFVIDVLVDGRDLTGPEQRIVAEYFEEEFRGVPAKLVDG